MRKTWKEPTTLSVSSEAAETLRQLQDAGLFQDRLDAYRFALAFALACDAEGAARGRGERQTIFNKGTFDPDETIYHSVMALRAPTVDEPVYDTCQRLAEWGLGELRQRMERGPIEIVEILDEVLGIEL